MLHSLEVEGLEWETPDQFCRELEEVGYISWLESFESPPEWEKRVRIVDDSKVVLIASK